MCGIAGFISRTANSERLAQVVQRMCDAMVHRGPDAAGIEVRSGAAIGMRRLAIFDPKHGKQPMQSAGGRYQIVFNGAIYNHLELRRELETLGQQFHSQCDTEVLLAAYTQWGEACLDKLRGMFAFAVWDSHERKLFAARDPFGVKPLYYAHHPQGGLLFASELRALKASGELTGSIDPASVAEYLAWATVPTPRTIYDDCTALRPGHCLHIDGQGRTYTRAWWRFPASDSKQAAMSVRSQEEFRRELRARLEEVARLYTRSDVPLGAFLSGGLDSTACVGLLQNSNAATRLKTFSIVFDEADFSEESAAQVAARAFGTDHHELRLTGDRLAADLSQILNSFDHPSGDGINTYYASLAAKQGGTTVAISGLGGDELFGGYPSFRDIPKLNRLLPYWHILPTELRRCLARYLKNKATTRAQLLGNWLEHAIDLHELASLRRRAFTEDVRQSLLSPDALRHAHRMGPLHPLIDSLPQELSGADDFQIISAWELRAYAGDILLRDSDNFSMAHSLELRVPLLDKSLVEWVWQQPTSFKQKPGTTKWGLAEATKDLLPKEIWQRRKQGFSLPFPLWMRGPLRPFLEECFSNEALKNCPWLQAQPAQRLWTQFIVNNDTRSWSRVWSLAMLVAFCQKEQTRG